MQPYPPQVMMTYDMGLATAWRPAFPNSVMYLMSSCPAGSQPVNGQKQLQHSDHDSGCGGHDKYIDNVQEHEQRTLKNFE